VADEPKPSWWKSIPGTLTAATGFVAALSGLVAGLNQLGVFKPSQSAPVVIQAPQPAGTTVPDSAAIATGKPPVVASGGATSTSPRPAAPAPDAGTERAPSAGGARPAPTSATPRPAPAASTANDSTAKRTTDDRTSDGATADQTRLATGATLELTVPARVCAPAAGQERFTARLAGPVKATGATLPAGSTAFLRLRRVGSDGLEVRLDSLAGGGLAGPVTSASVRIAGGAGSGGCLRPKARITVRLGAPVFLERR
jgi:hypothetical protein